jgi:peptide/nickel transport system ATP-binding protein
LTRPVLEVRDLTVAYRRADRSEQVVVSGAGFVLDEARVLGLAGETGCGKSTLALAAIGYRPPGGRILEGSSRLGDVDLLSLPVGDLRRLWGSQIGYVAQGSSLALSPAIPIGRQLGQVLARHLGLRGAAQRTRALELVTAVGLPEPERALARYPHQFSGGQQQRIAIAIALACRPQVLILDEPTTGLDVTTQARISSLIRALLADTGTAALYVSHDLALLSSVATDMAVMYAGEMVEHGPASEVISFPRHPYTQALLQAAPTARERRGVTGIPGSPPSGVVLDSCAFAPRCAHVIDKCRQRHVPLLSASDGHLARCIRLGELHSSGRGVMPPPIGSHHGDPLLEVDDLWCEYPKATSPAVQDVSFTLVQGETLGIVGESGSGKSTLLRAIVGLHAPARGKIMLAGSELAPTVSKRPRSARGTIQIVFQNPDASLNPRHTAADIVRRSIRLFRPEVGARDEDKVIAEMLEAVKLPRLMRHRYPSQLSGGQKQRVAIARAFAAQPTLLLCDEVTSALDVSVQATIIELIAQLAADFSTAVLFVSHDLAVVRTIAARTLVMKDGEICEAGETEQLFFGPRHEYTRELLSAVTELSVERIGSTAYQGR